MQPGLPFLTVSLSDHTSRRNMDLYLAVDHEVVGAENVNMSGKFLIKVYEGPYQVGEAP